MLTPADPAGAALLKFGTEVDALLDVGTTMIGVTDSSPRLPVVVLTTVIIPLIGITGFAPPGFTTAMTGTLTAD
jgi:hypothetical protein